MVDAISGKDKQLVQDNRPRGRFTLTVGDRIIAAKGMRGIPSAGSIAQERRRFW
ncbi:MAG: hypothetical protein V4610_08380 [Pseudomonadota bacterium]|jgi:hypothetical protein